MKFIESFRKYMFCRKVLKGNAEFIFHFNKKYAEIYLNIFKSVYSEIVKEFVTLKNRQSYSGFDNGKRFDSEFFNISPKIQIVCIFDIIYANNIEFKIRGELLTDDDFKDIKEAYEIYNKFKKLLKESIKEKMTEYHKKNSESRKKLWKWIKE